MTKFEVEGMDEAGNYRHDAEGAPFMIACEALQDWLPGKFLDRRAAEFACRFYERNLDYYAVVEFGHVKLYRLDGYESGNGRIAPIATFSSVEEFERFTKKSLKQFNNLMTEMDD